MKSVSTSSESSARLYRHCFSKLSSNVLSSTTIRALSPNHMSKSRNPINAPLWRSQTGTSRYTEVAFSLVASRLREFVWDSKQPQNPILVFEYLHNPLQPVGI